jgi:hypothetical protein
MPSTRSSKKVSADGAVSKSTMRSTRSSRNARAVLEGGATTPNRRSKNHHNPLESGGRSLKPVSNDLLPLAQPAGVMAYSTNTAVPASGSSLEPFTAAHDSTGNPDLDHFLFKERRRMKNGAFALLFLLSKFKLDEEYVENVPTERSFDER